MKIGVDQDIDQNDLLSFLLAVTHAMLRSPVLIFQVFIIAASRSRLVH